MDGLESLTIKQISKAARDMRHVTGHTHNFYRYPARFSPQFAAASINCFSKPGDVVLDPYMGGGTTVIEAMIAGRRAVGSDINQLAVFIAQTKVSQLSDKEEQLITQWAEHIALFSKCNLPIEQIDNASPKNMALPQVRWIRKTIALLLDSIEKELPSAPCRRFARCALLNVGQWALNGRKKIPSVKEFRKRITKTVFEMLSSMSEFQKKISIDKNANFYEPLLQESDAEDIDKNPTIIASAPVDLVVTSPPYPGIHLLYHRWQVDGRKETDAPYWISGCADGAGASFYNFADRRISAERRYFDKAERSFSAIRRIMREGATLVQIVAFSDPERQLRRYLNMLNNSGFIELRDHGQRRIWRNVPGRQWHAASKGNLPSSREVVLIHEAL